MSNVWEERAPRAESALARATEALERIASIDVESDEQLARECKVGGYARDARDIAAEALSEPKGEGEADQGGPLQPFTIRGPGSRPRVPAAQPPPMEAGAVPAGWPTDEMVTDGAVLVREFNPSFDNAENYAERVFRAMLAAASRAASPPPPSGGGRFYSVHRHGDNLMVSAVSFATEAEAKAARAGHPTYVGVIDAAWLKPPSGGDRDRVKELEEALRALIFAARTSGGTAGRDEFLCAACERAEAAILGRQP